MKDERRGREVLLLCQVRLQGSLQDRNPRERISVLRQVVLIRGALPRLAAAVRLALAQEAGDLLGDRLSRGKSARLLEPVDRVCALLELLDLRRRLGVAGAGLWVTVDGG